VFKSDPGNNKPLKSFIMTEHNTSGFHFESTNLLLYMWKRKTPLIVVSFLAFIASVIVSLTITPKYRSTVIFFPSSSTSISKALISTSGGGPAKDILQFGEEEETERLLQVLYSDEIREKLVEKYNLFEHYQIDPDSRYKYTTLYSKMKENISFRKTEYMSVRIDVLDTDRKVAADIANEIASLLDSTMNRMQKKRAREAYKIVEHYSLKDEISSLEDSLKTLGQLGVFNVEAQSQGLVELYLDAVSRGNRSQAERLGQQINVLAEHGGTYLFLTEFLENESARLSLLKEKYVEAKVDAEQNLSHTFIVNKGQEAEKKAYPKRSIIVIISTFSAFLFTLIVLVSIDSIRQTL
jgi:uncharacterized protein involved in exopolysaccharide biosynthesis